MRQAGLTLMVFFFCVSLASAESGLISIKSAYDVKTTADRLERNLKEQGMTVFIRIDHAQGARKTGQELRPTELIIFGNPKVGTPLIQCGQSVAIDLPQKALVFEDEAGHVWLTYNDPKYLADRHGITQCSDVVKKIENALSNFAKAATMP